MPLIYEIICLSIFCTKSNDYYNDFSIKQRIVLFSVSVFFDYIIEFIYVLIIKKSIGVWIFSKSFNDDVYGSYFMFVFLSITFIIVVIFVIFVSLFIFDWSTLEISITRHIGLIIFFVIFCLMEVQHIHCCKDTEIFNLVNYEEDQNTIYLQANERWV